MTDDTKALISALDDEQVYQPSAASVRDHVRKQLCKQAAAALREQAERIRILEQGVRATLPYTVADPKGKIIALCAVEEHARVIHRRAWKHEVERPFTPTTPTPRSDSNG